MNANLELTISCSTARGATIAMAWEITEIAVAPIIEKNMYHSFGEIKRCKNRGNV
jgi:predicted aspartyl protease